MKPADFAFLRDFLRKESGQFIEENKIYLLKSRLEPLARRHSLEGLEALVAQVKARPRDTLARQVVEAMTTNETLFFRDKYPFDALSTVIFPELMQGMSPNGKIRIWSAACSRGQETYSIAMTAIQSVPSAERHIRILGTDIADAVLAYAEEGIYTQMEVQRGMPVKQLVRYFEQHEGANWRIREELRTMISFRMANLIAADLAVGLRMHGPFDIVFCRNVMIYFDVEDRKKVIDKIAQTMNVGGYLITGTGELVKGEHSQWDTQRFEGRPIWKLKSK